MNDTGSHNCRDDGSDVRGCQEVEALKLPHDTGIVIMNAIFLPVLITTTLLINTLVCLVLLKPHMRTTTNTILTALAAADTLTGLTPLPCYLYFYTAGRYQHYLPYSWCFLYFCLTDFLPSIFHTTSVWLTVALAVQRYISVCHTNLAQKICSVRKACILSGILLVFASLSQMGRFFEMDYTPVRVKYVSSEGMPMDALMQSDNELSESSQNATYAQQMIQSQQLSSHPSSFNSQASSPGKSVVMKPHLAEKVSDVAFLVQVSNQSFSGHVSQLRKTRTSTNRLTLLNKRSLLSEIKDQRHLEFIKDRNDFHREEYSVFSTQDSPSSDEKAKVDLESLNAENHDGMSAMGVYSNRKDARVSNIFPEVKIHNQHSSIPSMKKIPNLKMKTQLGPKKEKKKLLKKEKDYKRNAEDNYIISNPEKPGKLLLHKEGVGNGQNGKKIHHENKNLLEKNILFDEEGSCHKERKKHFEKNDCMTTMSTHHNCTKKLEWPTERPKRKPSRSSFVTNDLRNNHVFEKNTENKKNIFKKNDLYNKNVKKRSNKEEKGNVTEGIIRETNNSSKTQNADDEFFLGCDYAMTETLVSIQDYYYGLYYCFRILFIHFLPCATLIVINSLLLKTMWQGQSRRSRLLKMNRVSESRRLAEVNRTTLMLVLVVAVFLVVELPSSVLFILFVLKNSLQVPVLEDDGQAEMASIVVNLCILLSYPVNFFIYCAMSTQFRDSFVQLFRDLKVPAQNSHSFRASHKPLKLNTLQNSPQTNNLAKKRSDPLQ